MHLQERITSALAERYEVKQEIGHGGMSYVYLAWDRRNEREVALKILKPELALAVNVARFLREIKTAARLKHPYILKLHDSDETDGILYYVMPFCRAPGPETDSDSLRRRLQSGERLAVREAVGIARDVAEALEHAHQQDVVHRDIKPENILFEGGHAVVADFGIAKAISEAGETITGSGVVVGTTEYMSPEQAKGRGDLDGRTDIYSLGLVLYEMLVGKLPSLDGDGAMKTLVRERPDVPATLPAVLLRALAHDRTQRYATAGAFADALAGEMGARRYLPRRWVRRVAMPGFAMLALGTLLFAGTRQRALDPNKVVVFPLVDRTTLHSGEDVASLIGAALEHTDPLIWIDGWEWIDARQRADIAQLTPQDARDVARSRGARYYVSGTVVGSGGPTVTLRLYDVAADSLIGQESAAGGASPVQLGVQAVNRLLPRLLEPGRRVDLSLLADRKPAAVAVWLQGEREYRRSRFQPALEYYRRAVAADSDLAFAALKGAQAAGWSNLFPEARQLVGVALRHEDRLPRRFAYLARGLDAYWTSRADTALPLLRLAVAADPDWGEARMALGEALYHLLPGKPDSAEASFLAAALVDTGFSPPLFHLAEMAIRRGDLSRAGQLRARYAQFEPSGGELYQLDAMLDCLKRGPRVWSAVPATSLQMLAAGRALSVGAAEPDCAAGAFRVVLARDDSIANRWGALVALQGLHVARGQDSIAAALLDSAMAAGTPYAAILVFMDAVAGADMGERASTVAARVRAGFGDQYERLNRPETQWVLGIWHAYEGDTARLVALSQALTREAQASSDRQTRLYADALAAHVSLARGDTSDAITRFRATTPTATRDVLEWQLGEPLAFERLQFARLLLARKQYDEAFRVAEVFDNPTPVVYVPFVPASLALRYRAAEALARADVARAMRGRLARLGREELLATLP